MENQIVQMGKYLRKNGTAFRILYLDKDQATIIELDDKDSKLRLNIVSSASLLQMLRYNEISFCAEEAVIIDRNALSEKQKIVFDRNKKIVDAVTTVYGPTFIHLNSRKKGYKLSERIDIADFGVSDDTFSRVVRKYLKFGMSDAALIDGRKMPKQKSSNSYEGKKRGRKSRDGSGKRITPEDLKIMDKAIERFLSSEVNSITDCYEDMLSRDYTICYAPDPSHPEKIVYRELDDDQIPTLRQFMYRLHRTTEKKKIQIAKRGERDVYANDRPFSGSTQSDSKGPGDITEMDAHEMDIAIVSSEYKEIPIGRPILYVLIDTYSRIILGVSLALDNNSVVGCTNCLASLKQDKLKLIEKYLYTTIEFNEGYTIDSIWPSNIRPAKIRVDRGSDFISDEFARICNDLNITLDMVTPATGSMKSVVERIFKDIEQMLKPMLEKSGLIRPVYGSKHHEKACLDIHDVMSIILRYVLFHNQKQMDTYEKSPDMIRNKVKSIPAKLWEYGCKYEYNPKKLPDNDQFLFTLLPVAKGCTISQLGIMFNHLTYFNSKDPYVVNMQSDTGRKRIRFEARYDPRDVSRLYYIDPENHLKTATIDLRNINLKGFEGMCTKRYEQLRDEEKEMDKEGEKYNREMKADTKRSIQATINAAHKSNGSRKKTKNMKEYRKREKDLDHQEQKLVNKFQNSVREDNNLQQPIEALLDNKQEKAETINREISRDTDDIKKRQAEIVSQMDDYSEWM